MFEKVFLWPLDEAPNSPKLVQEYSIGMPIIYVFLETVSFTEGATLANTTKSYPKCPEFSCAIPIYSEIIWPLFSRVPKAAQKGFTGA